LFAIAALVPTLLASVCLAQVAPLPNQTPQPQLKPGDIVYADSGDAIQGGFLIKVDPLSGQKLVLSSGGFLQAPFDPVIDATGQIIVSDLGRLIRVNPSTGTQSILSDNSRGPLGLPFGIALDRSGGIVAANLQAIVEVQPVSGQIQILSAGGSFGYPLGVAVATSGQLLVLNISSSRQILRVNPLTGAQRVVTQGGLLKNPQALAISGNDLYVTDVATPDGNFGIGRVIHVDALSGAQSVVAEGCYLVGPVGIAVDAQGQLIVGDPYTKNSDSPDLYDGGFVRIDPATGHQTLLTRGEGSFVNPRGVAIVPSLFPSHR